MGWKDRNVEFPNRYRIEWVPGTDNIADLIPTPGEVIEPGTYTNKANMLSDETAALLGGVETVNEAFSAVGTAAQAARDAAQTAQDTADEALAALAIVASVPVGSVFWHTETTAPPGYLICDGSSISRTDYARLFDVIGTTFGVGDRVTTFTLPDLRAKFIRGAGASGNYNVTFGTTQEATAVAALTRSSDFFAGVYVENQDRSDSAKFDAIGSNTRNNFSFTRYYVRPYNIALTPIIKY